MLIGKKQFFSQDPLVGALANEIESRYSGHVVVVNKEVTTPDGNLVTEFDIETRNAVIQVKSGGGKGLAKQILRTQTITDKPVIGYGPNLKPSVVRQIQSEKNLVTTEFDVLLDVIRPDP
ncbi:hypothetical protein H8E77_30240 [bacterium]|nr:hypothetical protein [bacterium]